MNKLDFLRGLVRPSLTWLYGAGILAIGAILIFRYADVTMARDFSMVLLNTGTLVVGFWFGQKSRGDSPRGQS